jgi:prolipoprotein diacylglyceryl transferase
VTTFLASFPSPSQGVWHLGWVPIRAYALFIIIGIIVALVIGDRRWVARGGEQGVIYDIALWAVPFGLVGGRLYHLITDWRTYFGDDGAGFLAALKIWDGGLGIWGAVALGGVGAWIGCRRRGIPLPAFGDAIAPGIVLAQAIGRLGNYFNQELYGRATNVPWGLKIYERRDANGMIDYLNGVSTGHVDKIVQPTFLYELIWNVLVFVFLIYADRRFKLGHGRLFALYVAAYCVGRFWVELLRDDTATHIAGIRINSFTSMFVFIGAVVYIILAPKGREDPATLAGKPREPKEAEPAAVAMKEPAAVETKEEVPQKPEAPEDSALVEWTKELAAVAATSGIVAGVAVAAEDEEADESAADGDPEPPDGDAGEPAEEVEERASAEAGEEGVAEEAEVEAEPAEAAVADEVEEAAEAEPEAEGEEAAEGVEAPPTEAAEPADAGAPDEEGEEAATAEPEAEAEVPTEKVTAESVAGVEQDDEEAAPTEAVVEEREGEVESADAEAAPTEGVVEEREGEVEPAEAEAAPTEGVVEEREGEVEPAEAEAAPTEEVVEQPEGEVEPAEAEAAPTEEVVDEAEAGEDGPGEAAGEPQPETEDGADGRDAEEGEEAEEAPKADSAAESSEERAEEVDAAEEAAPLRPQDIAAAADAQRRRWSLPRFRNRRT